MDLLTIATLLVLAIVVFQSRRQCIHIYLPVIRNEDVAEGEEWKRGTEEGEK